MNRGAMTPQHPLFTLRRRRRRKHHLSILAVLFVLAIVGVLFHMGESPSPPPTNAKSLVAPAAAPSKTGAQAAAGQPQGGPTWDDATDEEIQKFLYFRWARVDHGHIRVLVKNTSGSAFRDIKFKTALRQYPDKPVAFSTIDHVGPGEVVPHTVAFLDVSDEPRITVTSASVERTPGRKIEQLYSR